MQKLVKNDQYRKEGEMGRGAFGAVYRVVHLPTNELRAMKIFFKYGHYDIISKEKLSEIVRIYKKMKHPNVIQYYDSFWEKHGNFCLVTTICNSDLAKYLKILSPLPMKRLLQIFKEICKGVQYIHIKGFAHRDLKPANILIKEGRAVVADLDLLAELSHYARGYAHGCGTILYQAPEQLQGKTSYYSDIWALGAIAYEMATREMCFTNERDIMAGRYDTSAIPPQFIGIVMGCLIVDPKKRLKMDGLLEAIEMSLTFC